MVLWVSVWVAPGIGRVSKALNSASDRLVWTCCAPGRRCSLLCKHGGVAVQVNGDHHQEEVGCAGDSVERDDLRDGQHGGKKIGVACVGLVANGDVDKGDHAVTEFAPVQPRVVTVNKAGLFEPTHASPAWRLQQAGALRQLTGGQPCIALQGSKQLLVDRNQRGLHNLSSILEISGQLFLGNNICGTSH